MTVANKPPLTAERIHEVLWKVSAGRAGKDPDRVQTHRWLPWAEFRPAVELARETGRTQDHRV